MIVWFEFTVWISKLWLVDINLKIMTVGSKKKMTIELLDTNQTAVIRAAIPTVRSPILVVRWSETSIWQRRYSGWWDQSSGIRQSHYSDGSVIDSSSTVVEDIDLVAAVRWAARPIWQCSSEPLFRRSRRHYSDGSVTNSSSMVVEDIDLVAVVRWAARPIRRRSSEPLFRRFSHWTSTTSSSIGQVTGVGCLLNI